MAKYSVVGGSGFVGTNFCRRLALAQKDFEIIDIKPSREFSAKYKYGDVRDLDSLREAISGDIVVLLAAVHRDDVTDLNDYTETNVRGAQNVAQVCAEKGVQKIVFTSSVAVYGFAKPGTDEKGELNPYNEYGRSKMNAEQVLEEWQGNPGNSLVIVRPTVIFGEGNRGNVYNLLESIASNRFVMIGDGKNTKSMAYIGNIVEFLDKCCSSIHPLAVYNYVDTPNLSMDELVTVVRQELELETKRLWRIPVWLGILLGQIVDMVSRTTGKKSKISAIRVKKFTATTDFQSSKQELEDFVARFELKEGLRKTLDSEFINPDPNREIFFTE